MFSLLFDCVFVAARVDVVVLDGVVVVVIGVVGVVVVVVSKAAVISDVVCAVSGFGGPIHTASTPVPNQRPTCATAGVVALFERVA